MFGTRCRRGSVDDKCGCLRSMTGIKTKKATTTMKVVEITEKELKNILSQFPDIIETPEEIFENICEFSKYLFSQKLFTEGSVFEFRRNKFVKRIAN